MCCANDQCTVNKAIIGVLTQRKSSQKQWTMINSLKNWSGAWDKKKGLLEFLHCISSTGILELFHYLILHRCH